MDPETIVPLTPVLQYGFAGFSLVLLGVIVWQFRQLLGVLKTTNRVVTSCTHAIEGARETSEQVRTELRAMRDEQLRSGCPFSAREAPRSKNFILPDPDAPLAHGIG
jgi:hypothetical protein